MSQFAAEATEAFDFKNQDYFVKPVQPDLPLLC